LKRADVLSKTSITTVGIIGVAALSGYKDIKMPADSLISAAALFLILTLVSGFGLAKYVLCMSHQQIILTRWQYMLHVMLVSMNGVSLMGTSVFLLALVNHVNALLACFMSVVPFVIGMLAYAGSRINDNQEPRDRSFEAAMKSCSDVAYLTVGGAFCMQLAVIFEYYKNPPLRVNPLPSVDLSVTFLASMLGVFSMMVTAMPLEVLSPTLRSRLLPLVKLLRNSMLILTGAAAMTVGGKFLDGLVLLALWPQLVVEVIYLAVLLFTEEPTGPDLSSLNEEPEIPSMLTGATTTCIVLLSAVHALYTGGTNGDVYLRVGILFLISISASSLSWIAFLLMRVRKEQWGSVTNRVNGVLLGFEIIIAASFLLKIYVDFFHTK
jgi:hypothetical protein